MRTKPITKENITPEIVFTAPWRLKKLLPLSDYKLKVEFTDGICGYVDMANKIMGNTAGVFETLKDVYIFNQAHIFQGAATWPGEIDIAPDAMYAEIKENGTWVL